ncbi:hypothetical protein [Dysgonomonas mossii]|uniref:hypothetical protein n=1 Tax=Dysgonomonas mossii TaxID=163665 RepID=UPI0026EA6389|nr:hypothetical protein [Dysgonomonas mossii]
MRLSLTILFTFIISVFISAQESDFYKKLSNAAIELTKDKVVYDPAITQSLIRMEMCRQTKVSVLM